MSHQPCAIVGIGQTHHKKAPPRRVATAGSSARPRSARSTTPQMTWSDIDAVVVGKAPDLFEGVMKPELYLTDALGAAGKPMFRVHTAGSVGGTTGIVAVAPRRDRAPPAGARGRVREAVRGQRAVRARLRARARRIGAGGAFAPFMRSYMYRTGAPADIGPMVAVKDRQNAMKNPYAHLKLADISLETVKASPMMWDPVRFLESCPSSDGACAVVFTDEAGGERGRGRRAGRRRGSSAPRCAPSRRRSRVATRCARRARSTARPTCTRRPASPTRASRSTAPSSTCRSAGTSRCGSRPTTSPTHGEGWKMVERGDTALDGSFPVNMSGGVLSSNPIGASGLLRFAEAALQVRGMAGEHQVDGAKVALGPGLRRVGAVLLDVGRRQLARPVRRLTRAPSARLRPRGSPVRKGRWRLYS